MTNLGRQSVGGIYRQSQLAGERFAGVIRCARVNDQFRGQLREAVGGQAGTVQVDEGYRLTQAHLGAGQHGR